MGQIFSGSPCCRSEQLPEQSEHEDVCVDLLDSLVLRPDVDREISQALVDLLEAIELHRAQRHTAAAQKLAAAEHVLEDTTRKPADQEFWTAYDSDSSLQALRDELDHMDDILRKPSVMQPNTWREACARMADHMLERQEDEVKQAAIDWATETVTLVGTSTLSRRSIDIPSQLDPGADGMESSATSGAESRSQAALSKMESAIFSSSWTSATGWSRQYSPTKSNKSSGWERPAQLRKSKSTVQQLQEAIKSRTGLPHGPKSLSMADVQDPEKRLQLGLQKVTNFCSGSRIFEAYTALEALELEVAAAYQLTLGTEPNFEDTVRSFGGQLQTDPRLVKLRAIHARMKAALELAEATEATPRSKWATVEVSDTKVSSDFKLEVQMKQAENDERQKDGAATQLLACARLRNYPLSLSQQIASLCEMDLWKKEWIKDCKSLQVHLAGPQNLRSMFLNVHLSPSLLPISIEDLQVRDFAVCPQAPGNGSRPCVIALEIAPPADATEFEGWKIPPSRRGVVRLTGNMKVHFNYPSADDPNCIDIVTLARVGVPVRPWMLPLELLKKVVADTVKTSLRLIKEGLVDRWSSYSYDERIAASPEFYGTIADITNAALLQQQRNERLAPGCLESR